MKKIVVILVACLAMVAAAQAERILIDTGATSNPSGGNWNNFTVQPNWANSGGDQYLAQGAVKDYVSGATVGAFGISNIDDCRADSGTGFTTISWNGVTYPATATGDIIQPVDSVSGLASGPYGLTQKVIVSGLTGSPAYDVALYNGRNDGLRTGFFRVNGGAVQTIDAVAQNNVVHTFMGVTLLASLTVGGVELTNVVEIEMWNWWDGVTLNQDNQPWLQGYADLNVVDLTGVPEPATMGLLAIGALMALKRRRA